MQNPLSPFLGQLFGIYLVILGLGFLMHRERSKKAILATLESPALMFITGILTTLIGTAIVITHNTWPNSWEVLITLIGWLLLVQGAGRLLAPHIIARGFKAILHKGFPLFTWFWLLIGAYLLWSVNT